MYIHAWPHTVFISADRQRIAHLSCLYQTSSVDCKASNRISTLICAKMSKRIAVVSTSAAEMAGEPTGCWCAAGLVAEI